MLADLCERFLRWHSGSEGSGPPSRLLRDGFPWTHAHPLFRTLARKRLLILIKK